MTSLSPEVFSEEHPLNTIHQARGGYLVEYTGKPVPAHYGDCLAEYEAVRQRVGLLDLSAHGRIEVTGKERIQFLNGMVSNYVKPLTHGFGVPALFLTAQGKVVADCRLCAVGESFWIDLDAATHEKMYKNLFRLTFAGDFKVTDRTKTHGLLSLQGPQAGTLLAFVTGIKPDEWSSTRTVDKLAGGTEDIQVLPLDLVTIGDWQVLAVRHDRTGEGGYDLFIPYEGLAACWELLEQHGQKFGLRPVGWEALEMLRLEAGLPRYGADFDESVIALEAGLDGCVSYHKGCYVGQETIAKIHWRGHDQVAHKLTLMTVAGEKLPAKGTPIMKGEKSVGHTTSAVHSPRLGKILAFGYVRSSSAQPGTVLHLKFDDETQIEVEVIDRSHIK